jgi:hypothetical protein
VPTAPDGLAAGLAVAAVWWWSAPYLAGGAVALGALLRGWDHVAHFALFSRTLDLGSFAAVAPAPVVGGAWHAWNYPAGLHFDWAAAARLWSPDAPLGPEAAVGAYAVAVVATGGVGILLTGLAVARLAGRGGRGLLVAAPAIAGSASLLGLGLGSVGVWFGFTNFVLAVVAVGVAASFVIRPAQSALVDATVVSGAVLVAAYNWYPLAILAAPLAVPVWQRVMAWAGDRPARRRAVAGVGAVHAVAVTAAVVPTLGEGAEALTAEGGIPALPAVWLLVAVGGALVASWWWIRRTTGAARWAVPSVVAAAVAALVSLAWFQVAAAGSVSYYFEKLALGVSLFLLIVTALVAVDATERSLPPRPSRLAVEAGVVLVVAATVLSAVVVPRWHDGVGTTSAGGLWVRPDITANPEPLHGIAVDLLAAADAVATRPEAGRFRVLYLDLDGGGIHPTLSDFWVAALTGAWTEERHRAASDLAGLAVPPLDPAARTGAVGAVLPDWPEITVVAPPGLIDSLDGSSPERVVTGIPQGRRG